MGGGGRFTQKWRKCNEMNFSFSMTGSNLVQTRKRFKRFRLNEKEWG